MTKATLPSFLDMVKSSLDAIEAGLSAIAYEEAKKKQRKSNHSSYILNRHKHPHPPVKSSSEIQGMLTARGPGRRTIDETLVVPQVNQHYPADYSLIYALNNGAYALSLLHDVSQPVLVMLTDGVISVPDQVGKYIDVRICICI